MPLTAPDMSAMSRLLDEAMELPLSQHEAWLIGLDAKYATHLVPALRSALTERTGGASFLEGGPRLAQDDDLVEPVEHESNAAYCGPLSSRKGG